MSTEEKGDSGKKAAKQKEHPTESISSEAPTSHDTKEPATPHHSKVSDEADKKQAATKRDQASESTSPSTPDDHQTRPRQVIAVSASKGPAAFFNLARKFLVTDEICDFSALEGAIVSAVDAAHLLERSKLAKIVKIQTSYVSVEPKRRKTQLHQRGGASTEVTQQISLSSLPPSSPTSKPRPSSSTGRELRRARIVITVKRTESYKQWLDENPIQAVIAEEEEGEEEEVLDEGHPQEEISRR